MSRYDPTQPTGWRGHPLLLALLFVAIVGAAMTYSSWSWTSVSHTWHHWWHYPQSYAHQVGQFIRVEWEGPKKS